MKYKIASGETLHELSIMVNELIQKGWEPLGGVNVYQSPSEPIVAQAMIKK